LEVIDFHSHVYPPHFLSELNRWAESKGDPAIYYPHPLVETMWDIEKRLAQISALGIDVQVLSLGNPWVDFLEGDAAQIALAQRCNDFISDVVGKHGSRFVGWPLFL